MVIELMVEEAPTEFCCHRSAMPHSFPSRRITGRGADAPKRRDSPKPEHSQPTLDPPPGPFTQGDYKYDDTPTPEQRERERAAGKIDALGLKNIGSQMERDPQGVTRGSQLYVKKERGLPRMR